VRHSRHRRPRRSGQPTGPPRSGERPAGGGGSRPPARHALRLTLAIGTGAAGLCVVFGMVSLVVALGNGEVVDPLSTATNGAPLPVATSARHEAGPSGTGLVAGAAIASYRGPGAVRPARIRINVPDTWGIYWSFICPAGRQGDFAVKDTSNGTPGQLNIHDMGQRGQGLWWNIREPGYHILLIISDCSWRAQVVLPARVNEPPGHSHQAPNGHHPTPGPKHSPTPTPGPRHSPTPTPRPRHSSTPAPGPQHSPSPGPRPAPTPRSLA